MNFFYGTYGFDILSILLLFIGLTFSSIESTLLLGIILIFISLLRGISKNCYKRYSELSKFIIIINKILKVFGIRLPNNLPKISLEVFSEFFYNEKLKLHNKKLYKTIRCPKCNEEIRVLRGTGLVTITCHHCAHKFNYKA